MLSASDILQEQTPTGVASGQREQSRLVLDLCGLRFRPWLAEADERRPAVASLLLTANTASGDNVGPEKLRSSKAWKIHPIKLLAER